MEEGRQRRTRPVEEARVDSDRVQPDGEARAEVPADARGDDVYQPDGSEVQDDEGLLPAEDTLDADGVPDPLDRGYSPPERPRGVESHGVTGAEQAEGDTLEQRLARELPEPAGPQGDGIGDTRDTDGEPRDGEVGDVRAGRLVGPDEGAHENPVGDLVAEDVGIDGAAASAEEAAVHLVDGLEGADGIDMVDTSDTLPR